MGPEMEVNDEDVYSGLLAYFVARPVCNGVSRSTMLLQTNFDIDLNLAKPSLSDEWEFLGIVSEGRKFNLTSNLLDQRLTGIPLSFMYVNPLQNSYYSTVIGNNMGRPEYFTDTVQNKIIITAGGDVILSLKLAWMSTNLERVHARHLLGVARLISIPYYERILALRTQIAFQNTDYQINTAMLEAKLAENKEKSDEFLKSIRMYVMFKA